MKYPQWILYTLSLSLVAINFGCRKEQASTPPPVELVHDVITTGGLYNETKQTYNAYYWKNSERFELKAEDTRQAFAYGLDKTGQDMYIAGGYQGLHPVTGASILLPCYWKNGNKINLPVQDLHVEQRCGASDVRWLNNALYVSGDVDMRPVVWKIQGGQTKLIEFPVNDSVIDVRRGSNLQVYNGKVYMAGNQKIERQGSIVFNAGYWVITEDDKPEFHVVENNLAYALCFALSVSKHGIFVTGEYSLADVANSKPAVWTSEGRLPVADQLHPSYNRLRGLATDDKGNVYMILHDIQLYQPVLWKLPVSHHRELIKPQVPENAKGLCATLDVYGENLAYSYLYEQGSSRKGFYVFREQVQELDIDNSPFASFNRTRIFSR